MEFELKELRNVIGRELARGEFLASWGRLAVEIGCLEESRVAESGVAIRNRAGAHEWGSLEPLIRPEHGDPGRDSAGFQVIAITTHTPCAYLRRWLSNVSDSSCSSEGEFDDLDGLLRFDGLDRRASLWDPARVPSEHRDLKAAMVLARCQARSAALEAGDLCSGRGAGLLVLFGVGLESDRVLFGGAYHLAPEDRGPGARFVGVGDDPARYSVSVRDGELRLWEDGEREVLEARDHRARIQGLLGQFDRFDPEGDLRVGATDTPVGLKICLRVHAQKAPVQAVMRLLGAGFLDIRQMIWFSSAELTAGKVRRARELLRCFEIRVDRLDGAGLRRLEAALGC